MLRLCLVWTFCLCLSAMKGQSVPELQPGTPVRHHWQHTYNRLIEDGDGNYYLFQNREGSYWNFGQGGVARGKILVFDSTLSFMGRFPVKVGGMKIRVLEAFPDSKGVSVVGLVNDDKQRGAKMILAHFHPEAGFEANIDTLMSFPRYSAYFQLPRLRVLWDSERKHKAIAWRVGTDPMGVDNNLGILILDENDRPVGMPFYPLTRARAEVELLKMAWVDAGEWLFHLRAFAPTGKPLAGQLQGQVLARFDESTQTLETIPVGVGRTLLDLQWARREDGSWDLAGVYADPRMEPVEAGLFWGRWAGGDSLERLHFQAFPDSIRNEFVLERLLGKDPVARPLFYNRLVRQADTLIYVVNPKGGAIGLNPEITGKDYHAMLLTWRIDPGEKPVQVRNWGLFHDGRTDYGETFSWTPIRHEGNWYALTNDFSQVKKISKPTEAVANLLPLSTTKQPLQLYNPQDHEPFTVLSPRSLIQTHHGDWVGFARSDKYVRLLRLEGKSNVLQGSKLESEE